MTIELFANSVSSPLSSAINTSTTSLSVVSASGFSAATTNVSQFRVLVDSELMIVTNVSGTTFTVTRAQEGTVAASHSEGAKVSQILTAGAINNLVGIQGFITTVDVSTTSTVLANVSGMAVSMGANDSWVVKWDFFMTCAASSGLTIAVTVPTSATLDVEALAFGPAGTDGFNTELHTNTSGARLGLLGAAGVTATSGIITVTAKVAGGGTAGNIQLQLALVNTNTSGTASIIKTGAGMLGVRIA